MARYTGPGCRICRRFGEKLMLKGNRCQTPKCAVEKRHTPPGEHAMRRRRKLSERGIQLREKQKVRYTYGVMERQFRRTFAEAERRKGITGETLLQLLELRLDNVVYRLGFADSRRQSRQLVRHGHFVINGRKTDIPSASLKVGDTVAWAEGSTKLEHYQIMAREIQSKYTPPWLSLDLQALTARVTGVPARSDVGGTIQEEEIVAYYSR